MTILTTENLLGERGLRHTVPTGSGLDTVGLANLLPRQYATQKSLLLFYTSAYHDGIMQLIRNDISDIRAFFLAIEAVEDDFVRKAYGNDLARHRSIGITADVYAQERHVTAHVTAATLRRDHRLGLAPRIPMLVTVENDRVVAALWSKPFGRYEPVDDFDCRDNTLQLLHRAHRTLTAKLNPGKKTP